jgi:hypothetical protein
MVALVRLALQVVLFFLLLGSVVGLVSAQTGVVEKAVLVAFGGVVIWLAWLVRRMGARSPSRST